MAISRKLILLALAVLSAWLLMAPPPASCQVSPAEIMNPRLKALAKANLDKLMDLNTQICALTFPYPFALRRYVGLDPGKRQDADTRGIEFVKFHDLTVLKVSGNYGAAFNADMLTQNERANQVFNSVVVPILPVLSKSIPDNQPFDAFGFEISYHVRTQTKQYGYEGRENLVVVFNKADVPAFINAQRQSTKQEIIDHSQVYLDGKEFGLALGEKKAFDVEQLDKSELGHSVQAAVVAEQPKSKPAETAPAPGEPKTSSGRIPPVQPVTVAEVPQAGPPEWAPAGKETQRTLGAPETSTPATAPVAGAPPAAPAPSPIDVDAVQKKYQAQLDQLTKDGIAQFHFVSYAPASLGLFHNQIYLQLTLRNPELFDKSSTSIYKRAAQSLDLFLAPHLKELLAKIPADLEVAGVDFTVLDQFSHAPSASGSSAALEFICPISPLRHFADAEITNQDLIQQSIVLVNGVRIALNLQQVE